MAGKTRCKTYNYMKLLLNQDQRTESDLQLDSAETFASLEIQIMSLFIRCEWYYFKNLK